MNISSPYIDEVFHFPGQWDMPSLCGLKIVRKAEKTVVVVTNLYEDNPGTSVSRWVVELAKNISDTFHIPPERMVFIEHNPDKNSRLEFYKETFDLVIFRGDMGEELSKPVWQRISRLETDRLLSQD